MDYFGRDRIAGAAAAVHDRTLFHEFADAQSDVPGLGAGHRVFIARFAGRGKGAAFEDIARAR